MHFYFFSINTLCISFKIQQYSGHGVNNRSPQLWMVAGCLSFIALEVLPEVAPRSYKYALSAFIFKYTLTLQQRASFIKITEVPFKFTQNYGEAQYTLTKK